MRNQILLSALLLAGTAAGVAQAQVAGEKPRPTSPSISKPSVNRLPTQTQRVPTKLPRAELPTSTAKRRTNSLTAMNPAKRPRTVARFTYYLSLPATRGRQTAKIAVQGDPCRRGAANTTVGGTTKGIAANNTIQTANYDSACLGAWRDYVARLDAVSVPVDARNFSRFALPARAAGVNQVLDDDRWARFLELPHIVSVGGKEVARFGKVRFANVDADADGFVGMEWGGDDCDETDANRYPGNSEVPDVEGHDEDCDYRTIGTRDIDNDGFIDARIWNRRDDGGRPVYGDDCDDTLRGVNPGQAEVPGNGLDDDCDGDIDHDESWRN